MSIYLYSESLHSPNMNAKQVTRVHRWINSKEGIYSRTITRKLRKQHRPINTEKTMISMNISKTLLQQAKEAASIDDRTTSSYIARAVKHYLECQHSTIKNKA